MLLYLQAKYPLLTITFELLFKVQERTSEVLEHQLEVAPTGAGGTAFRPIILVEFNHCIMVTVLFILSPNRANRL